MNETLRFDSKLFILPQSNNNNFDFVFNLFQGFLVKNRRQLFSLSKKLHMELYCICSLYLQVLHLQQFIVLNAFKTVKNIQVHSVFEMY